MIEIKVSQHRAIGGGHLSDALCRYRQQVVGGHRGVGLDEGPARVEVYHVLYHVVVKLPKKRNNVRR